MQNLPQKPKQKQQEIDAQNSKDIIGNNNNTTSQGDTLRMDIDPQKCEDSSSSLVPGSKELNKRSESKNEINFQDVSKNEQNLQCIENNKQPVDLNVCSSNSFAKNISLGSTLQSRHANTNSANIKSNIDHSSSKDIVTISNQKTESKLEIESCDKNIKAPRNKDHNESLESADQKVVKSNLNHEPSKDVEKVIIDKNKEDTPQIESCDKGSITNKTDIVDSNVSSSSQINERDISLCQEDFLITEIKQEPEEDVMSMFRDLGSNFSVSIETITDPFLIVEISSDSSMSDEE